MAIFDIFKRKPAPQKRESSASSNVVIRTVGQKKYAAVTDPYEAMKCSIVYRGIAIVSDSVASIPIHIYHKNKQGYWEVDEKSSMNYLFSVAPCKRQNIYEFLEGIVTHMIIYGNAYVYITRDSDYEVKELTLLYPHTCAYDELADTYTVSDYYNNISGTFKSDRIIHFRHKSLGTYIGESVLSFAGRTIGLSNATDTEALSTMQTGGRLKGIISSESSLSGFSSAIDGQVDTIRDNMQAEIDSGKDIITLQSGAEFKPISQTMRDLQLTDLHQITLSDLARYFGVSLAKLGINLGGNYQASLQDSMNFFTDTLKPLLKKLEAAFNYKLIPQTMSKKYKIEFDITNLTYFKEILSNYDKMMTLGLLSVNDIRKQFNQGPTEGGDTVLVTTNSQPISAPKVDPIIQPEEPQAEPEINKSENNIDNDEQGNKN